MNIELIGKIERMSKFIDLIAKLTTLSTLVTPVLVVFINYVILGMGEESCRFAGTYWLPFDANHPVGFAAAMVFQCVSVHVTLCAFRPIVCILIGSSWSIVAFLKDIGADISELKKKKIAN